MLSAGHDPGELESGECLQHCLKLRGETMLGGKEQRLRGREMLEGEGVPGEQRRNHV